MERTMTNEEKAREIANNSSTKIVGAEVSDETYITTEPDCYTAAITMAKWKDEQFKAEKQALIDKACEWWENELTYPTMTKADMFYKESMIEEFKQAMKGGEQ